MGSKLIVAELPLGQGGLNGSRNLSQVPVTSLIQTDNLTYENGTIQKEGGATKYNSTAITGTPAVIGGYDWNHDGTSQMMVVVTDDGVIRRDNGDGSFPTNLASGLTVNDIVPTFMEGGAESAAGSHKLFIYTQKNAVQVLTTSGTSTSDLSTPPTDWSGTEHPSFGIIHEGIHFAGGCLADPTRLYYSTATDDENFTGAGSGGIAVYHGEGEELVGAMSFKGGIITFKKPIGVYFVDTSDADDANWRVKKLSDKLGCVGPQGFVRVEDDIVFMDQTGDIRLLSAVDEFGDVGTRSLSDQEDMGPWIRENVDLSNSYNFRMVYYSTKREVHLACTGTGASTNNLRIVMDFNDPRKVKFRTSSRDTCVSLWTREVDNVPELTHGDDSGFVYQMDQDTRSKDSSGYSAIFQTAHTDLSYVDAKLSTVRKNGKYLELVTEPKGNWDLSVDVFWDGDYSETVDFNMGTQGSALGSFTMGTDRLGGDAVNNRKRRIVGSGRRISLKGTNNGDGEDFSAAQMYLHFTIGNQRL